jgi:hypothetical protein
MSAGTIKSDIKLFSFVSLSLSHALPASCRATHTACSCLFDVLIENRIGGQNLGNVISQILLCKQITPDFQREELGSITKDSKEIARVLSELQEFMPKQEAYLGKILFTHTHDAALYLFPSAKSSSNSKKGLFNIRCLLN